MEGISLRDYFAAKAMNAIACYASDSFEEVAKKAYEQADAMMRERGIDMAVDEHMNPCDSPFWRVLFIGGPRHGETCEMEDVPFIDHPPGQYHRHFLGIEDACSRMVYLWSELHAIEAVDLVFEAIQNDPISSLSGNLSVALIDGNMIRIAITSGLKSVSLDIGKEAIGKLIEELSRCYNGIQ